MLFIGTRFSNLYTAVDTSLMRNVTRTLSVVLLGPSEQRFFSYLHSRWSFSLSPVIEQGMEKFIREEVDY